MRIEKLTLRGFLRFREPVSIDLTDVPPGLVAIVGPNGAGKTTLLEAAPAALYRSFMSRGDLIDYATERDSYLELQLAVDGRGTYRARINVDAPKRASDAVLEQLEPNGSRVVLNDGKVSTFDQVVAREFPSRELLLASAFAAQNKAGSFISLDKKNRKTLFAQLLGIERYEAMSSTARQAAALVEQARGRLQAQCELLARETADGLVAELARVSADLETQGRDAATTRAQVQTAIAALEARLATLADIGAAYAAASQRLATLRATHAGRLADLAALDGDLQRLEADLASETERLTVKREADMAALDREQDASRLTLMQELLAADTRRETDHADIAKKIAGNQQLLGMAERIRAAVAQAHAVTETIDGLEADLAAHQARLVDDQKDLRRLDGAIAALAGPEQQLARARTDAALLGAVPCGGAGDYARCEFLANATAAAARIPDLEAGLASRAGLEQERATLLTTIQMTERAVADARRQVGDLRGQRVALQDLTKYAEPLAAAEARIAELTAQQGQIDRAHREACQAADARHAERQRALADRRERIAIDTASVRATIEARTLERMAALRDARGGLVLRASALADEIATAEADLATRSGDHEALLGIQAQLRDQRVVWDATTAALARVASGQQELQRRRDELDATRAHLADLQGRIAALDAELLDWQALAKAFSRDGLPVLEIDAAGPTISAYTNELLEVCFGPRFSVDLVTQQAKADGKGVKEDFSIRVLDNVRGGDARDIADLSGGEQVLVAEALANAICIYVNTRSPQPVRTCWRDETTGALDAENAARYLVMLRKVQALGGFHHTLFISHNADAAALADAQIQIGDGAATLVFPPYGRAEAA